MNQTTRLKKIEKHLSTHKDMVVDEACRLLDASPATVRRDFNELVSRGVVDKVWGGIIKKEYWKDNAKPLLYRKTHNINEKKAIARLAVSLINDGDVIMIDGGTTTLEMAALLVGKKVRIITNSLLIANAIHQAQKSWSPTELFITGGLLYRDSGLLIGPEALQAIAKYHANWAFLSCGGINENGIFNTNQLVVETEQEMIRQSQKCAVLADQTKFGNSSMSKLCEFDDVNYIITDTEVNKSISNNITATKTLVLISKNVKQKIANIES